VRFARFLLVLLLLPTAAGAVMERDEAQRPSTAVTGAPASEPPPERWGFGRLATEEEIDALDIDVMPDGTGLPPGEGTVTRGEELYYQLCASCHGIGGKDGVNDQLVGRLPDDAFVFATEDGHRKTVGNYWQYATTLYDYTYRAMPFDEPGSLTPDEVYSLVAWILHENGIIEAGDQMNAQTLPKVQMPAKDRFVPDDRTGGPVLK